MPPYPSTKAKRRLWVDDLLLRLEALAADLRTLRAELHNRVPEARAKATSRRYDETLVARINSIHEAFPDLPQHEIAKLVDTNQGRINNALRGIRT